MRSQKGIGLIEILLALVFISFSIVAITYFQGNQAFTNDFSIQQNDAILISMSKLETLTQFSSLTGYNAIASGSSTVTGTNTTFQLSWTVTSYTNPTYKNINLLTSWTDRRGSTQSVRLVTNVAGLDPTLTASIM